MKTSLNPKVFVLAIESLKHQRFSCHALQVAERLTGTYGLVNPDDGSHQVFYRALFPEIKRETFECDLAAAATVFGNKSGKKFRASLFRKVLDEAFSRRIIALTLAECLAKDGFTAADFKE